ncbi:hypothetical protein IEQ34_019541 [Dendrobium chrysotoxum]|uniref:Uncharacterized protein n=1 Tax=Dendrobium chrysotoxum TaxID=161865 RepID=A0AAV7G911_DENCH|nr:hypothetical protein IEQ34_019541 [Dendrobium chrysotoxum]
MEGAAQVAVKAAPSPKSPPKYPDFCGRRRLQLEVQILNREIGFLEIRNSKDLVAFGNGLDLYFAFPSHCSVALVAKRELTVVAALFRRTAAAPIVNTSAPAAAPASALVCNASVQRALASLSALAFSLATTLQPLVVPPVLALASTFLPVESLDAVLVLVTVTSPSAGFLTAAAATRKFPAAECLNAQLVIFPSACLGDGAAAASKNFPAPCQGHRVRITPAAVSGPAQNVQKHGSAVAVVLVRAHVSLVVFVDMDRLLASYYFAVLLSSFSSSSRLSLY